MQGLPLVYLFLYLIKQFFFFLGGGICEADVWVQHGSVRRVMGSETLNTSARLTLLTVPGWVGQCARLANGYQAQLSPAGTKSWSDHWVLATVHQRPQYHNSRCLASTLCYWGDPAVPPELQERSYDLPSEARSPAAEDAGWWWDFCGIARRSSKRRCRPREGSLHPRPVQSL